MVGQFSMPIDIQTESTGGMVYLVVNYLWSDGQAARTKLSPYSSDWPTSSGKPTGWTTTLYGASLGLPNETHTLEISNATYNPMGFSLTIDGQYSCTMP